MTSYLRYLVLLVQSSILTTAYAYDTYVGPYTPVHEGELYAISYDYAVSGQPSPEQNQSACSYAECKFSPIVRTGLGPNGFKCDSGGICNGAVLHGAVTIANGATWNDAFAIFLKTYPASGTYKVPNWVRTDEIDQVRWDALCVGFASLPALVSAVSVLAPGTSCSSVPRPDLSCTVDLPSVIDFGTVKVGTSLASAKGVGRVECDREASITASMWANPRIDGNDVEIDINGIPIGNAALLVGTGKSVPLQIKATIRGSLRNAGSYSSDAILQISYH